MKFFQHHDHHLQQQLMHQHMMHHQNPHLHAAHFYDDQRLGTLSEPGQHFADMSDLRSEIDKAGSSKGLKGLSMSVPDLSGEHLDGKFFHYWSFSILIFMIYDK